MSSLFIINFFYFKAGGRVKPTLYVQFSRLSMRKK